LEILDFPTVLAKNPAINHTGKTPWQGVLLKTSMVRTLETLADKGLLQKISKRCILNNPAPQLIFLKASLHNHVTSRDSVSLHFTTSVGGSWE
jgi:hypothetical protein